VFIAYLPNDKGPVFMRLLERTFGQDITTRTLETVRKCARAWWFSLRFKGHSLPAEGAALIAVMIDALGA
jgi:hypothetical protein